MPNPDQQTKTTNKQKSYTSSLNLAQFSDKTMYLH